MHLQITELTAKRIEDALNNGGALRLNAFSHDRKLIDIRPWKGSFLALILNDPSKDQEWPIEIRFVKNTDLVNTSRFEYITFLDAYEVAVFVA